MAFDRRNAKFSTAIRNLYRSAGQSKNWKRIAIYVRHLCITVTLKSPPCIWNLFLSLPNLSSLEVIGEYGRTGQAPPVLTNMRAVSTRKLSALRLRGYFPAEFVSALCKASAGTIGSLDLGLLDVPLENPDKDDLMCSVYDTFFAPRGLLSCSVDNVPMLNTLTHLNLCKPGCTFWGPDNWRGPIPDVEEHIRQEFELWVALL